MVDLRYRQYPTIVTFYLQFDGHNFGLVFASHKVISLQMEQDVYTGCGTILEISPQEIP